MGFNKKIGVRIRRARREAEMSQEELASLLNISRVSVVNIEGGRQACGIERLMAISRITGFSMMSMIIDDSGSELPELKGFELSYELHRKLDRIEEKYLTAFIQFYERVHKKDEDGRK